MGKDNHKSALDRAILAAMGDDRPIGRPDDQAREVYPQLWDWLSRTLCGRDRIKQPAVLSIRLGPEGVLVTLTDRDLSCSFDVSCAHLDQALAAMEAALNASVPPMRNWGKTQPNLRKRKSGS